MSKLILTVDDSASMRMLLKVSLTARSRALAARMAPRIEAVYAGLAQRLGEGRIDALLVVLDELIANLDAPDVGDPHQE